MIPQSIRWRIQMWHGALLTCLVIVMLGTFYVYIRAEKFRAVDDQLESYLTPLMPRVFPPGRGPHFGAPPEDRGGPPMDGPRSQSPQERGRPRPPEFASLPSAQAYYTAWSASGTVLAKTTNSPVFVEPKMVSGRNRSVRTRDSAREIVIFTPDNCCIILGCPIGNILADLNRLAWEEALAGMALVVFGLAGGWWVSGRALQPIHEISSAAEEIASGDRTRRINVPNSAGELGTLAAVLNRTFDRLDKAFERQVQFTADASHELRTPVSVILTQTQLALARDRSAPEYRDTLASCQRAAERMRGLINTLLELARTDASGFDLTLVDCDLRRIADSAMELVGPIAVQKNSTLCCEADSVCLKADGTKLEQVLVNLLQNAVVHNPPGTKVTLSVHSKEGYAIIKVIDTGAGIPEDALPKIFDRFFRIDKSRSSATGGSGLGLAICKSIVEAHNGTIIVESTVGKGTEFRLLLPIDSTSSSAQASF